MAAFLVPLAIGAGAGVLGGSVSAALGAKGAKQRKKDIEEQESILAKNVP